jgi:hypothetical protein
VFASFLKYQVLETSLPDGATIQLTLLARQIRNPPPKEEPSVGAVTVTVAVTAADVAKAFIPQIQ